MEMKNKYKLRMRPGEKVLIHDDRSKTGRKNQKQIKLLAKKESEHTNGI